MATRSVHDCRGILTGASSGIGRALATQLVREGARLVAVARRTDQLQELARDVAAFSGRLEILCGDITQSDVRRAAVERAHEAFGGLDLIINNAGVGAIGRFAEASPDRLRQVMELNFFAPVEMIRAALPLLKEGKRPIVVNVSSILGYRGIPFYTDYCASKFALAGFSESLRAELAGQGIDVLVVSPGPTQTAFFDHAIDAVTTPWPKPRGLPPDVVARKIIRAIRSGRHAIVIGAPGKLLVWGSRAFPWLLDRILARYA